VKPHKKAKSGAYVINYYDEEGYAALRKVSEDFPFYNFFNCGAAMCGSIYFV
jgi:hypothetical protein